MFFTLPGISTFLRLTQSLNASTPMNLTPLGIIKMGSPVSEELVKLLQRERAEKPM